MSALTQCPHCGGESGFQMRETYYATHLLRWDGTHDKVAVHHKPIHVSKRRSCTDCGKAVGAILDYPTFKL